MISSPTTGRGGRRERESRESEAETLVSFSSASAPKWAAPSPIIIILRIPRPRWRWPARVARRVENAVALLPTRQRGSACGDPASTVCGVARCALARAAARPTPDQPQRLAIIGHSLNRSPSQQQPFQVVLWTACLLSSSSGAARADSLAGRGYLQRETGNLKCFTASATSGASSLASPAAALFDDLLLQAELHREREEWYRQRSLETLSELTLTPHGEAELGQLRSLLPLEQKGLPAPFTGVAAID